MHQSEDRTARARRLRSDTTSAEAVLWSMLRGRRFEGLKFRRQAPVAGFVVDFLCAELRLVIELDGGVHRLREFEDAARDARITAAGFVVLRFGNEAFKQNPNLVFEAVRLIASQRPQPPHPTGSAGHLLPRGEKETG
ncbi:endonuclease domain-containing protein [Brevundimonas sp. NPDC092305]|uniref:endonuclease domain-containing protein n=1 Tax=Brevundimonas sp. NPDC092305 TaxID=3363957 RepID=UPI00380BEE63